MNAAFNTVSLRLKFHSFRQNPEKKLQKCEERKVEVWIYPNEGLLRDPLQKM